jgi:hypothetical protein
MMTLTDPDAAELVALMLNRLEAMGAQDVIAGIDESRRLGIEEPVVPLGDRAAGSKRELKKLGTVRRRPPTELEMLRIVFERVHQRLVVIPAIARTLQQQLKTADIVWRVDHEFVPSDRSPSLEADIGNLLPAGSDDIVRAYRKIAELIPELVPSVRIHG